MRKKKEDDFLQNSCCAANSHSVSCLFFDHVLHRAFLKCTINWCGNISDINMSSMKHHIVHSDDYVNQCKCRQNFNDMLALPSSESCTCIHKFPQKCGFKGAWDGASKLIKSSINKLETNLTIVANACDCCRHMTVELTRTDSSSVK